MKKKVLALILTAAMVVGLAACGGSTSNDAASTTDGTTTEASDNQTGDETTDTTEAAASTGEKILSVQVGPDPETIDPALNSAVDGGNMLLHSFECLLAVDENGQLVPGQAESWETSEDGLTWTFHLRVRQRQPDFIRCVAAYVLPVWQNAGQLPFRRQGNLFGRCHRLCLKSHG